MSQSSESTEETMSQTETNSQTSERGEGSRHPAIRVFASELTDSSYSYKVGDAERSPKYTLLPSGERVNRILIVGALMDVDERGTDNATFVNGRVHDGKDYFYITSTQQYTPDAANALRSMETPAHVAIVGKLNHYQTQDGEHRVEVKAELVAQVSAEERYQWVLETARDTRNRVERFHDTPEEEIASGSAPKEISLAHEQYDIDPAKYLNDAEAIVNNIIFPNK